MSNSKHIGVYTPLGTGHINTVMPLVYELIARGHRVSFLGIADMMPKIASSPAGFININPALSAGASDTFLHGLRCSHGFKALYITMNWSLRYAEGFLVHAPMLLKMHAIDFLLVDQICLEGLLVAHFVNIPALTVCSALPLNQEPAISPVFLPMGYTRTLWRKILYATIHAMTPTYGIRYLLFLIKWQKRFKLSGPIQICSPQGTICQMPEEFDFPRTKLPPHFLYTGPMHKSLGRPDYDFPWSRIAQKKVVYVSLGTLHSSISLYTLIARTAQDFPFFFVMAVGELVSHPDLSHLPSNLVVVKSAPQLEILKQCLLMITHAGLNSTLEALSEGVPLVCLPITNDQPGVAARVVWNKCGVALRLNKITPSALKNAIQVVLNDNVYATNARRLQKAIKNCGGVSRAASLVEELLAS